MIIMQGFFSSKNKVAILLHYLFEFLIEKTVNMPIYRFHPVFIFFCAIITLSCRNPYFEPLFKVPLDTVKSDIQKIVKTQDINIEGHNTPLDDTHVTSLGIQLINAQNINVPPD